MTMARVPQIVPESAITSRLDAAIRDALCECFPADRDAFAAARAWHASQPAWTVLVEHQNIIIAHVGIVERTILAGGQPLTIAGIQNMLVRPAFRGQGLFRQVMTTAMTESRRRNLDLGLLFCTPDLAQLYAHLGWHVEPARPITRLDEQGHSQPLPPKNLTMFHPLRLAALPPGDLHLQGNDW